MTSGTTIFRTSRRARPRVTVIAAARPNFMKVGPVVAALRDRADVTLVHTGQHYDERMSASFFDELGIPEPDHNLEVGSGTHAEQTGGVMVAFERHLDEHPADAVVVVGDVNSTLACTLVATKAHVPVAHVEAGLRSRDWRMPEEVNRVATDRLSRWLFATDEGAVANLAAEGTPGGWVHLVGNVMIDTLLANLDRARERHAARDGGSGHLVLTLHRPSNVDDATSLRQLVEAAADASDGRRVVFPAHPRTVARLADFGVELPPTVEVVEPLPYLSFIGLVDAAAAVLTDSGGLQEETSVLGVPCLTLRENTERPITIEQGTNVLVGTSTDAVHAATREALTGEHEPARIPLWDGRAGDRIADVLLADLATER